MRVHCQPRGNFTQGRCQAVTERVRWSSRTRIVGILRLGHRLESLPAGFIDRDPIRPVSISSDVAMESARITFLDKNFKCHTDGVQMFGHRSDGVVVTPGCDSFVFLV